MSSEVLQMIRGRERKTSRLTVRKRCTRCKAVGWFTPAERVCRQWTFGKGSWACGGKLDKARPVRRPRPEDGGDGGLRKAVQAALSISPEAADRTDAVRRKAQANLDHASVKLDEALVDLKRVVGRVTEWQRKVRYYSRRASVTPAEVMAEMARRKTKGGTS